MGAECHESQARGQREELRSATTTLFQLFTALGLHSSTVGQSQNF